MRYEYKKENKGPKAVQLCRIGSVPRLLPGVIVGSRDIQVTPVEYCVCRKRIKRTTTTRSQLKLSRLCVKGSSVRIRAYSS